MVQTTSGEITEAILIMPWLEGCSISEEVTIPIDTIIVIALAKARIADRYRKLVVGYKIQDEADVTAAVLEEMNTNEDGTDVSEEPKTTCPPMFQPNFPPREPERLTRERMMESDESGELEEDMGLDEPSAASPIPAYKVNGQTRH
jgi:hypothetical protein